MMTQTPGAAARRRVHVPPCHSGRVRSVNKIMLELKGIGFDLDFPASKLKQGSGDAVCAVLNFLCDQVRARARACACGAARI